MATSTRKRKPKGSSKQEVTKQAIVADEPATAPQATVTKAERQTIAAQTTTEPKAAMAEPPATAPQATVAEEPIMAPQAIRPAQRDHTNGDSPTREDIERRAYELFIARGAIHGNDLEDWFRAEQEFRGQAGAEF